jgi:acyl-CoA synthetase (AMP-forming)/AMP-acid ligase II
VAVPAIPELDYKPTIPAVIRRAAEQFGDQDFIVMPDRRMTYGEAEESSRWLAKFFLANGLGKGSRIGIFYTYGTEFVITWLAGLRIGALVTPFSTLYQPEELRTALRIGDDHVLLAPPVLLGKDMHPFLERAVPGLEDASADKPFMFPELPYLRSIWITGDAERPWARSISLDEIQAPDIPDEHLEQIEAEVTPADLAQVTYTSGSSALPKGVVHTQGAIVRSTSPAAMAASGMMRPQSAQPGTPKSFCAFPFFWIGGTLVLGSALQGGRTVCVLERFEPGAVLDMIEKEQINSISAWPSLVQSLRTHPSFATRDLSSIPMLTQNQAEAALASVPVPGIPGHRAMSETVGNWNGADRIAVDPEDGRVLNDLEEGELWIRGYGVTVGYYKKEREETFDENGWLHTGDRVFMYENRAFFVGRYYEMIKSKGANVSPREVEMALETYPEVTHALVFSVPHPDFEEEVAAAIVPAPGVSLDTDELMAKLRTRISSYKVPTRIYLLTDESKVPWLGSGKPDKLKLKELLLSESSG